MAEAGCVSVSQIAAFRASQEAEARRARRLEGQKKTEEEQRLERRNTTNFGSPDWNREQLSSNRTAVKTALKPYADQDLRYKRVYALDVNDRLDVFGLVQLWQKNFD